MHRAAGYGLTVARPSEIRPRPIDSDTIGDRCSPWPASATSSRSRAALRDAVRFAAQQGSGGRTRDSMRHQVASIKRVPSGRDCGGRDISGTGRLGRRVSERSPVAATSLGEHRFDDRLEDMRPAATRSAVAVDIAAALTAIDPQVVR
jgi:hypothetical protein